MCNGFLLRTAQQQVRQPEEAVQFPILEDFMIKEQSPEGQFSELVPLRAEDWNRDLEA